MRIQEKDLQAAQGERGRELDRFSEEIVQDLGLGRGALGPVRGALAALRKLPIVWFQFSPVVRGGDAFARCTSPWAGDLLFAQIGDGSAREPDPRVLEQLTSTLRGSAGRFLCVLEGAPARATPALARVARTALQVCGSARAVLCIGAAGAGALAASRIPAVLDALGSPAIHVAGAPPTAAALAAALVTKLAGSALRDAAPAAARTPPTLQLVR